MMAKCKMWSVPHESAPQYAPQGVEMGGGGYASQRIETVKKARTKEKL